MHALNEYTLQGNPHTLNYTPLSVRMRFLLF